MKTQVTRSMRKTHNKETSLLSENQKGKINSKMLTKKHTGESSIAKSITTKHQQEHIRKHQY